MSRAQAACETCGESVDAPDTPLGRAIVAAFEDMHRGHSQREQGEADPLLALILLGGIIAALLGTGIAALVTGGGA